MCHFSQPNFLCHKASRACVVCLRRSRTRRWNQASKPKPQNDVPFQPANLPSTDVKQPNLPNVEIQSFQTFRELRHVRRSGRQKEHWTGQGLSSRSAGQEDCQTGGVPDRARAGQGQAECRTGGVPDRRSARQKEHQTGQERDRRMLDRRSDGQGKGWTGGVPDRSARQGKG